MTNSTPLTSQELQEIKNRAALPTEPKAIIFPKKVSPETIDGIQALAAQSEARRKDVARLVEEIERLRTSESGSGKLRTILNEDGGMHVMHTKYKNYETVLIDPPNFSTIHVIQEHGVVQVYIRDHCHITIDGKFHETPTIVVDSDEYPTRLKVQQTDSKWISVDCLPEEGKRTDKDGNEWRKVWMKVPCLHEIESVSGTMGRCKKCGEEFPKETPRPWYTKEETDERLRELVRMLARCGYGDHLREYAERFLATP